MHRGNVAMGQRAARMTLRPGLRRRLLAQTERIRQQAIRLLPRLVIVDRGDDHQLIRLAWRRSSAAASP